MFRKRPPNEKKNWTLIKAIMETDGNVRNFCRRVGLPEATMSKVVNRRREPGRLLRHFIASKLNESEEKLFSYLYGSHAN